MMPSLHPVAGSAAQRTFLEAAERLGATSPARAQPLSAWPRLSARELEELVDQGLVREADAGRYYGYAPRTSSQELAWPRGSIVGRLRAWQRQPFRALLPWLVFWLVFLLVPVILLHLMRG